MPDFAKERGGLPLALTPHAAPQDGDVPHLSAPLFSVHVLSRVSLDDATRALDGIGGLGWSVIGFVVGAVFWHFIGFWGFVADVVLAGGPPAAASRASAPAFVIGQAAVAPSATSPPHGCTMLALDRRSRATSARPCGDVRLRLPADAFQGREDRVAVADPVRR